MDGRWDGQLADDRGFGNWSWGWTLPHKTLRFLMNILNDLSLMPGSRSLEFECMARSSFTFHCFTPRSSWLVVVGQLGSWLGGSWLAAGGGFLLFFCVACFGWFWLCGGWSYSRHSWPATPALARGDKKQSFIISMTSSNRELKSLMCTLLKHRLSGFVSSDIGVFTLLHRYINQLCTPADVAPSATPLHLKIGNAPRAHKSQRFGFTNATVGSLCYQLKRWKQWRERTEFSRQRDDSTANLLPVHSHQWPLGKSRLPLRSLWSWPGRQARSAQQRAARACKKKHTDVVPQAAGFQRPSINLFGAARCTDGDAQVEM